MISASSAESDDDRDLREENAELRELLARALAVGEAMDTMLGQVLRRPDDEATHA